MLAVVVAPAFAFFACGSEPVDTTTNDASVPEAGVSDTGADAGTADAAPATPAVTGVTASNDIVTHVRVAWVSPSAAVTGYRVLREGVEIGRVGAGATSFDDATAAPASLAAPRVTATTGTVRTGITVAWEPTTANGTVASYAYSVVALYAGREASPSESKRGSRPGLVTGYEVIRADGTVFSASVASREITDTSAPKATVALASPSVTADAPRALVALALPALPTVTAAATASYKVRALSAQGNGPYSAPVEGRRGSGLPNEVDIQWQRSAGTTATAFADLPEVTGLAWFDTSAPSDGERHFRARSASPWAEEAVSTSGAARRTAWQKVAMASSLFCGIDQDGQLSCWQGGTRTLAPTGVAYDEVVLGFPDGPCARRAVDHKPQCWQGGVALTTPDVAISKLVAGQSFACGLRESDQKLQCWSRYPSGYFPDISAATASYISLAASQVDVCALRAADGVIQCFGSFGLFTPYTISAGPLTSVAVAYESPMRGLCGVVAGTGRAACSPNVEGTLPDGALRELALLNHGMPIGIQSAGAVVSPDLGRMTRAGESYHDLSLSVGRLPFAIDSKGRVRQWAESTVSAAPSLEGAYAALAGNALRVCGLRRSDGRIDCRALEYAVPPSLELTSTSFVGMVAEGLGLVAVEAGSGALRYIGVPAEGPALPSGAFERVVPGCGLRATDRKVACWNPSLGTPPVIAFDTIDAGDTRACGIRASDKRVECWGAAFSGALPSDALESISVFGTFGCGVRASDHKAVCWGEHTSTVAIADELVSVTADSSACGIRRADHTVVCEDGFTTTERFASWTSQRCGLREGDGKWVCRNGYVPIR